MIKALLHKKNITSKLPAKFINGDSEYSTNFDIATGFNIFFAKVGRSFARSIPLSKECLIDIIMGCFPTLSNFDPPTCAEVLEIINNLKNSAAGHDEIKAKIIKEVASSILLPLTQVTAICLKTVVVPSDLKVVKVLPLFKEGDSTFVNNY